MTIACTHHNPVEVIFGEGRAAELPQWLAAGGSRGPVLLVTDGGIRRAGLDAQVREPLEEAGIAVHTFAEVNSDPKASTIDRAAELIAQTGAGCVIGLGGGSAMDTAKTAALVTEGDRRAIDYADGATAFPERRIRSVIVPTTAGTGAEVSQTVVYSDEEGRKYCPGVPAMLPDMTLLDPRLTAGLPARLTAATGLDAMVHAIEACTGKKSNPFIRGYALEAIRLVSRNLDRALAEPENMEARGNMLLAATLAGFAINDGGTGLAHCMGHALGSMGPIHHGRAVTEALLAIYRWNAEAAPVVHADIARAMGVAEGGDPLQVALAGAERFEALVEQSGLPDYELEERPPMERLDELVSRCQAPENIQIARNSCREAAGEDLYRFGRRLLRTK